VVDDTTLNTDQPHGGAATGARAGDAERDTARAALEAIAAE